MGFFGLIPFVVIGAFCAIAFFWGRHAVRKNARRLKQVQDTPLVKAKQVAGHVGAMCKMHGEMIAPGGTLQSPIDGLECVWFRLLVEEQRSRTVRDSKGNTRTEKVWVPVLDASKMVPCGIADKDGAIEVSLIEADLLIKDGAKKESGYFADVPARLRKLIEEEYKHDTGSENWFSGKKSLRVKEQVLEVGEKALVVGKVKLIRTDRGVRPRFVRGKEPLMVTDKDADGLASHYKWAVLWGNLGVFGGGVVGALALVGFLWVLYAATMAAVFGPSKGQPSGGGGLVAELKSQDKWVRIRAANRITHGPKDDEAALRPEVAAALLANLKAKDEDLVKSAAEALPAWVEAGQSAELIELLGSKDGHARRGALKALGALDTAEGATAAAKHLTAGAEWREALNALKQMKASGEPALRQYLADKAYGKNEKVAAEACKTLREVGTKDTLPVLDALAKEAKGALAKEAKAAAAEIRKRG